MKAFINAFLPPIAVGRKKEILSSPGAFREVPSSGAKPSDIYTPLVRAWHYISTQIYPNPYQLAALNSSTSSKSRAPGLVFENASSNSTEPHTPGLMKPHICCYTRGNQERVRKAPILSRADLGYAELFVEVKPDNALDFFADPSADATSEECGAHDFFTRFPSDQLKRRAERAFGQHIAYALEIQARQHRVHLFSISVAGSCTRLLRWDRSGIIVTESFDILMQPDLLCDFLGRFAFASDYERGHDDSVKTASPQEELLFRDVVAKYVQDQLDISGDDLHRAVAEHYQQGCVYAMCIFAQDSATPAVKRYLVSRSVTSPLHLVGQATRGHWAVQANTERLVFLKDTWRWREEREGTVVADLNAAGVRNVQQFVAQGDVYQYLSVLGKSTSCIICSASFGVSSIATTASSVHHTETDRYDTQSWVCPVRGQQVTVSTHIHYRLILWMVGYPVRRLKGTDELLHSGYDIFQGEFACQLLVALID